MRVACKLQAAAKVVTNSCARCAASERRAAPPHEQHADRTTCAEERFGARICSHRGRCCAFFGHMTAQHDCWLASRHLCCSYALSTGVSAKCKRSAKVHNQLRRGGGGGGGGGRSAALPNVNEGPHQRCGKQATMLRRLRAESSAPRRTLRWLSQSSLLESQRRARVEARGPRARTPTRAARARASPAATCSSATRLPGLHAQVPVSDVTARRTCCDASALLGCPVAA